MGRRKKEEVVVPEVQEEKVPFVPWGMNNQKEKIVVSLEDRFLAIFKDKGFPTPEAAMLWLRTRPDKMKEVDNIKLVEKHFKTTLYFIRENTKL